MISFNRSQRLGLIWTNILPWTQVLEPVKQQLWLNAMFNIFCLQSNGQRMFSLHQSVKNRLDLEKF